MTKIKINKADALHEIKTTLSQMAIEDEDVLTVLLKITSIIIARFELAAPDEESRFDFRCNVFESLDNQIDEALEKLKKTNED